MARCGWVTEDPIYIQYHDEEWGKIEKNEHMLFELLILEGAQAGLSWLTVLKKRAHYREVFDQFDPEKVAQYDEKKVASLLADPGIIRNRLKVNSAISNAKAFLAIQEEFGSFYDFLWSYVGGEQVVHHPETLDQVPVSNELSERLSKALKKRGFKFVGGTIMYSYLQAVGVINDHLVTCPYRH